MIPDRINMTRKSAVYCAFAGLLFFLLVSRIMEAFSWTFLVRVLVLERENNMFAILEIEFELDNMQRVRDCISIVAV